MIAVCLLTCDRPELTQVSASSFKHYHHDRTDLLWWHCDGGSLTRANVNIAKVHGFETLIAPDRANRIGQMATLHVFLRAAHDHKCDWMLWLENDWETVKPIPDEEFLNARGVDTVRLFGEKKFRDGPRQWAGKTRLGTIAPIVWAPDIPGWEMGYAHWAAGATLVKTDVLWRNWNKERLKDVILAENNLLSLRPVENIMWCVDAPRTEGYLG